MTATSSAKDSDGRLLEANIASLQTAVNAAAGKSHRNALELKLDQLQRELVHHFLDVGRLTAANIISTMS